MSSRHVARLKLLSQGMAISLQAGVLAAVATVALTTLQSGKYSAFDRLAIIAWLAMPCLAPLLLSPLIGALAGSSRVWQTMVAASTISAAVVSWAAFVPDPSWFSVFGELALASAFFTTAAIRLIYATLPDARLRSTTTMVLLTLGVFAMVPIGFELGLGIRDGMRNQLPRSSYAVVTFAFVATVASVFSRIRPTEFVPLSQGIVRPFADGVRDVFRQRHARYSLIGLWVWMFFAGGIVVCVIRLLVAPDDLHPESTVENFTTRLGGGVLWGIVLSALNRNAFRFGWLIPYSAVGAFACLFWLWFGHSLDGPLLGIGIALGAALPPLVHYYFSWTTPKFRGAAAALLLAGWCAMNFALAGLVLSLEHDRIAARSTIFDVLLVVAGLSVILSIYRLYRPALEGTVEFILWPVYRVRAVGPGVEHLPTRGPCLVIGNHAAWFDPLFLAKVLPLPTTPMMTSKFYDLPVLSWIMRKVIGTIRVPDVGFRHEAPELQEAIAALDRDECVVLFPEGYLRRKEEQPLRRFGRGVWKIIADRPATPVFACWIEGNWGSFLSHKDGPPTKGKRIDFWKHIDVGILGPIVIEPAMLADHMATRLFLMQQVAAARAPLGLPPIDVPAEHADEEKE